MTDEALSIDLNADLGEAPAALEDGREALLLDQITSANIACGGHAGDARTMRTVIGLAAERGVGVGAHPGYDDRAGFGRVAMAIEAGELARSVERQVGALLREAESLGVRVGHVKPHGALYHAASVDMAVADAILEAVRACDGKLALVAAAGSPAERRWVAAGATVIAEGFADRRYRADGTLLPRGECGAVIDDPAERIEQAIELARARRVRLADGAFVGLICQTICVHSDSREAALTAERLRRALSDAGIRVERPR